MKKLYILILTAIMVCALTACSEETVELHCDTEGCENAVTVELEEDVTKEDVTEEDWVVFCDECANKVLNDQ